MTVKMYMSGIRSFYSRNDIELPKLLRTGKVKSLEENTEIPEKEDLQDVLKICDPLEKAVLLVGASSGLSANEITNLKVKDFKKGYDSEKEVTTLKLRREKVKFDFITFLSPEASRAVWDYINYRGRTAKVDRTRRQRQLEKQYIYSDDDFLFINRHVSNSFSKSKDENERKIDRDAFMKIYRVMSEKAQKSTPKMTWNLIRSHNIRKYFNSVMLNAGADSFHVEFFMGHTLDDTKAAYFRASPEKLKEIYLKYVPYLTIQKELDPAQHSDF